MYRTTPPDPILALAEAQRGVVARYQLLCELREAEADDLLRSGWFERLVRGVYRVRGGVATAEQQAFAAALRARPAATVTGPLVLGLLDVPAFAGSCVFELLHQPGRRLTNLDVRRRVDHDLDRAVARYGDVRVAGPLDALIDSAAFLGEVTERDLRVAWDHLRGTRLASVDRLRRRLDELREVAPGAEVLERVLELAGGIELESEGERAVSPVFVCFEPGFERQVWVTPRRRTDFYSRRCRMGYEYLGDVDHGYVAERLADDQRDAEVQAAGVRLGYVTKHDLREPTALVATIAASLTVRAHELGVVPPVAVRTPVW
jgi:hypothetical protein